MKKKICILGSTGSIGCNTLDLISQHRDNYEVETLTANENVKKLAEQAIEFQARNVAICDGSKFKELKENFQPQQPSEYLNREEVAEMLQVDVSTIHNWRKAGKISAYGIGGKRLYKRAEVESALIKMRG